MARELWDIPIWRPVNAKCDQLSRRLIKYGVDHGWANLEDQPGLRTGQCKQIIIVDLAIYIKWNLCYIGSVTLAPQHPGVSSWFVSACGWSSYQPLLCNYSNIVSLWPYSWWDCQIEVQKNSCRSWFFNQAALQLLYDTSVTVFVFQIVGQFD